MRKFIVAWLLILFAMPAFAAVAATPASSAQTVAVQLTPEQARQALDVLNDPKRRAQVNDTLKAIAAAGALSAPPAPASAASADAASASAAASGAESAVPAAFKSNGLASQLVRQGVHWSEQTAGSLSTSLSVLLDVTSVHAWWSALLTNPDQQKQLRQIALALLGVLLPAFVLEWIARRLLRRAHAAIIARADANLDDSADEFAAERTAVASPETTAAATASTSSTLEKAKLDEVKGKHRAAHHWSLLRRLPRAFLGLLLRFLSLGVFIVVATVLMSIITDPGTPQDRALDSLIDIYLVSRTITILGALFLQPNAPRLRLLRMTDTWATFVQRWLVLIVTVVGAGSAIAELASALGLSDAAHLALMKVVTLVGHVMISVLILQCRRPVADRIRANLAQRPSIAMFGNAIAESWATFAVFVVMALWFVWALNVENGYERLLRVGGWSVAIVIGARIGSIVVFGALARIFHDQEDNANSSVARQHAYRYYPMLRRIVSWIIGAATALLLLQVWGFHVGMLFQAGTVGHRLASALVTIAVAAVVALLVWEAVNVNVERRLHSWTTSGDLVRAARLRTLLPMLRTALFCAIALVVVLTGLSELGVNIGPLLAGASIFGVALGFGSQKLVQDFITGIFLLMENAMQVGDWVTLAGVSGTVEYLSIRTVRLRGGDGSLYTVPFSSVSTVNNTNRGLGNAAVKVMIAYGQDVDLAAATLKEIGASLRDDPKFKDGILSDFALWGVDSVDGASVTLAGQVQCRDTSRWGVQREFNRRIFDQFSARGIQIFNPQRNVLVSAPKGFTSPDDDDDAAETADIGPQRPMSKGTTRTQ
ncbi:mechanosensitive ion channel domain-containing protein [Paraburkholderia sp.]|uniref:mechanosensitive ion channel domain-containing protein n=1 Tax=Paraburkholderia sp. TaxID=1926495 RepID=UPI0023A2CC74|nr:mechanosensitive ion channel domain-containing protein [Paraburkholderia sp.]MDE1181666.1 mechanosensitive ion channel [Paraburkholderia sp.]